MNRREQPTFGRVVGAHADAVYSLMVRPRTGEPYGVELVTRTGTGLDLVISRHVFIPTIGTWTRYLNPTTRTPTGPWRFHRLATNPQPTPEL